MRSKIDLSPISRLLTGAMTFILVLTGTSCAQFAGGDGSESNPWQIETSEQLQQIADYPDDHFILAADLDLADVADFAPIGNPDSPFSGVLDGAGYTVSNLNLNRADEYTGLFAAVSGKIKNLNLVDVDITGAKFTGGLAGYLSGTVTNCYVSGTVVSESAHEIFSRVGVMIGAAEDAVIEDSNTSGEVTGNRQKTGGIAGSIRGTRISDSYSEADVTGYLDEIGGIAGQADGNSLIEYSYAEGNVAGFGETTNDVGGLIGELEESEIRDSFATGNVSSEGGEVGGLVGEAEDYSVIRNSYATGDVSGVDDGIGGLVGELEASSIFDSYATGRVTGQRDEVGGLVGQSEAGSVISNTYATGDVRSAGNNTGGLVGENEESIIEYSYATGNVESDGDEVGGLAGENEDDSIIRYSFSTGVVVGNGRKTGGLVGENYQSVIYDSHSWSVVEGQTEVAGIAGRNNGDIKRTYWAGTSVSGYSEVGAIIGSTRGGAVENNYWDAEISQKEIGVGYGGDQGTSGHSTEEMMSRQTFENWDFDTIWMLEEGSTYPKLRQLEHKYSSTNGPGTELPGGATLDQNYPNPFNPSTLITFNIDQPSDLKLEVYDVTGRHLQTLKSGEFEPGTYHVEFDATGLAAGVYFYRLQTSHGKLTRMMTYIK